MAIQPGDVTIVPEGMRLSLDGFTDVESAADCISEWDDGTFNAIDSEPPAIGLAPTGVDANHAASIMLADEFGNERAEIDSSHARHKKEMLDIMATMEAEFNEQEGEARQEFESAREEIKNKNSEEYNVLRFTLEGLIEELERHFDSAHANYMATTEQRTQDFKHLTIKDQQSAKTIEMQMRKLQRLQDSLAHWKTKLASNGRECDERNRALREEKDAISRHFQELKSRMNKFRESEGRRLQELVINAQSALKALQAKLEKAERILRLAELARKLRPSPSPSLAPALALALALALPKP